ncbi:uncharacterized protein LOC136070733 [Quercus suber]|uniref:uncharacterized protein LOC136070733 n=1 Tax=Quercus suber TaxID=58331 RepID=UPI0032E01888
MTGMQKVKTGWRQLCFVSSSQSGNYVFWKVRKRAFLCSIVETVWDAVDVRWSRLEATKSTWDKAALAAPNTNSKALNAILFGVSPDEFHRISHITFAKEAWEILETTYEGTKKVNDTKLQMLTTQFKELKISEDESFDSFYSKLIEVVIGKFNFSEKMEDSKIVRKILRSLPESFRAKVTAIEESKDLDDIKVQELIGSLQTYELSLPLQRKSKSLTLKTTNERVDAHDSLDEDKFKKNGKFAEKGKFQNFGKEKKDFKRKDGKESQSSQGIICFECNGHGHLKRECPNYLKGKGKVYATTLSDSNSSNLDSDESFNGEGNFSAFMTIAPIEFSDDLRIVEESDDEEDEGTVGLQETYNSLLEKTGEYAKFDKAAIKKMKRAEEDYRSLLVQYKETKCEMKTLNEELNEAYSKIKFLELEVIQTNVKVKRVSSKKLDEVLAHQKPFSDKSKLGYTRESSLIANMSKEMKFVKAKEPTVTTTATEKVKLEKKRNVNDQ